MKKTLIVRPRYTKDWRKIPTSVFKGKHPLMWEVCKDLGGKEVCFDYKGGVVKIIFMSGAGYYIEPSEHAIKHIKDFE